MLTFPPTLTQPITVAPGEASWRAKNAGVSDLEETWPIRRATPLPVAAGGRGAETSRGDGSTVQNNGPMASCRRRGLMQGTDSLARRCIPQGAWRLGIGASDAQGEKFTLFGTLAKGKRCRCVGFPWNVGAASTGCSRHGKGSSSGHFVSFRVGPCLTRYPPAKRGRARPKEEAHSRHPTEEGKKTRGNALIYVSGKSVVLVAIPGLADWLPSPAPARAGQPNCATRAKRGEARTAMHALWLFRALVPTVHVTPRMGERGEVREEGSNGFHDPS